jgi:hypothetical protein
MLGATARPSLPAVVLVMKPRDPTVDRFTREMGYTRVRSWPPPLRPRYMRPAGYTVWPRHTFDPDRDDPHMAAVFGAAMQDSYRRGDRILFADEMTGLTQELGLSKLAVAIWTRGRTMHTGVWAASQRPAHIPLHAYSQASHLFLFRDRDKRNRERYGEIGGMDPREVQAITASLPKYHALYIQVEEQRRCIVGP